MVRDGYFYAIPLLAASGLIAWLAKSAWAWPPALLAVFFLWFFRDPERIIPGESGALVSPADGRVTLVSQVVNGATTYTRISIFLSVFDVHVNRSPISGTIRDICYQKGKFLNAMAAACAEENEQNIVTVDGGDQKVIFKQIAGLLARRIVFTKKLGDPVKRGERVGMIKFGSRVDVLMESSAQVQVKVGDHVKGGSSVLAYLPIAPQLRAEPERTAQGVS